MIQQVPTAPPTRVKEIIVFGEQGDPRLLKTFSNVGYFLVSNLEKQGVRVHTVDLSIREIWQKAMRRIFDFFGQLGGKTELTFQRSRWHTVVNNRKIKKALRRYPDADALLFTSFSFSASHLSTKPSFLFCDWDLPHFFNYLLERKPSRMEQKMIDRQKVCIESAAAVFVLFPAIAERMKMQYRQPNLFYLGNVVNNLRQPDRQLLRNKRANEQLLFIGNARYLAGFLSLLDAFLHLKPSFPRLQLHAIGISKKDLPRAPADVFLHGYLDKEKNEDQDTYYQLLNQSTIFINTHPKWAAFSATLEAMFFYTPVIVTDYEEFRHTFGNDLSFGQFFTGNSSLTDQIRHILENPDYSTLSNAAHDAAKIHNWQVWVSKMLDKMEAHGG